MFRPFLKNLYAQWRFEILDDHGRFGFFSRLQLSLDNCRVSTWTEHFFWIASEAQVSIEQLQAFRVEESETLLHLLFEFAKSDRVLLLDRKIAIVFDSVVRFSERTIGEICKHALENLLFVLTE